MRPFVKTRSLAFFGALFLLFLLWMAKAFSPAPDDAAVIPSAEVRKKFGCPDHVPTPIYLRPFFPRSTLFFSFLLFSFLVFPESRSPVGTTPP